MRDLGAARWRRTVARRIAGEVAAGLVVAHAAGLVHRDLKPDNVFLTRSGVTKILDFGIAKLTDDPAGMSGLSTLTGVLLGTAGYLAPEQIRGGAVDDRTDLFALGSMLFEMATGQRAFAREHTVDTLHAILHEDPSILSSETAMPPELAAIVMRLLEKEPAARFQSAADLEWALARIARTPALHPACRRRLAVPVTVSTAAAARARTAIAIAAIAVIGLVGIGLAVWSRPVVRCTPDCCPVFGLAARGQPVSQRRRTNALAFSPDGSQLAFIARSRGRRTAHLAAIGLGVEPHPLARDGRRQLALLVT